MKAPTFVGFISLLLVFILTVFFHFKNYFSGADYYKAKTAILKNQIEREKLNAVLSMYQLQELKQQIAETFPEKQQRLLRDPERGYPLRNLASVVGVSAVDSLHFKNASTAFEDGKAMFRGEKYNEAVGQFKMIVEKYPDSVHIVKSHFLLVESFFKQKKYDLVIDQVDKMVTLFPDDEVTGFALLRLALVFELEERPEDAIDIYNVVLKEFKNSDLRRQARQQREQVRL